MPKCRFDNQRDCPFEELPSEPRWCLACLQSVVAKNQRMAYEAQRAEIKEQLELMKLNIVLTLAQLFAGKEEEIKEGFRKLKKLLSELESG